MKKIFGIALVLALVASLCFGTVALADDPPDPPNPDPEDGVVKVFMDGNDYSFEVETWTNDSYDQFSGEAHSSLWMVQTVRYQPSGQWTSDAPDIDRWAGFEGEGHLEMSFDYNSSAQWYNGASHMEAGIDVESGSSGYICQQLHFGGHWGGVKDVDQYKKQRNMWMHAEGEYEMWLNCFDTRADLPNYGFHFEAIDDSSEGWLFADTICTGTEHGSGQYHVYDTLTVDFQFGWNGDPAIVMGSLAERGGNIDWQIDLINDFVSGQGTIW